MSNRLMSFMVAALALLFLSGCAIPPMPEDLIGAPNVREDSYDPGVGQGTGGNAETSLLDLLPDGARLLAPGGQGNGPISYGDLDGDGRDEAIVVYQEGGGRNRMLKAALLTRQQDAWQIIWHGEGSGHGLDYAGIHDVDRDGSVEILLGWSLGEGVNGLDIYEWDQGTLKLQDRRGYHESKELNEILHPLGHNDSAS